jgi:nucleotide-binding universal stress UspA family protein
MTQDDPAAIRSHHCPGQATGGPAPVIVVGLDGSPASWDAFAWAAGEAVRSNGSLIAVYATPAVEPGAAFGGPFDYAAAEQARQEAARLLAAGAAQLASDVGVPLSFVREPGGVTRALTCVAHSARADLVVVGRSAKTLHRLAGSAGGRLVSRHDAPVVVVVP